MSNLVGWGYRGVNYVAFELKKIKIKRLFQAWRTMIEARLIKISWIQHLARELGGVTSSMEWTKFLKTFISRTEKVQLQTLDASKEHVKQSTDRFNQVQRERFETTLQAFNLLMIFSIKKMVNYQRVKDKETLQLKDKETLQLKDKEKLKLYKNKAKLVIKQVSKIALLLISQRLIDLFRVGFSSFKIIELERIREANKSSFQGIYQGDSRQASMNALVASELISIRSMIQTADYSVESNVYSRTGELWGYIRKFIELFKSLLFSSAKKVNTVLKSSKGELLDEFKKAIAKSIIKGDDLKAKEKLLELTEWFLPRTSTQQHSILQAAKNSLLAVSLIGKEFVGENGAIAQSENRRGLLKNQLKVDDSFVKGLDSIGIQLRQLMPNNDIRLDQYDDQRRSFESTMRSLEQQLSNDGRVSARSIRLLYSASAELTQLLESVQLLRDDMAVGKGGG
tara:strand:- start:103 stop:1461 length:1359 start_codon:yes stop_codon:yes gene_type:complete